MFEKDNLYAFIIYRAYFRIMFNGARPVRTYSQRCKPCSVANALFCSRPKQYQNRYSRNTAAKIAFQNSHARNDRMLQQLISKAESYAGAGDYANAIDTFTLILSRLEDCSLNTLALTCDAYIGIADAYEKLYGYEKALDILADGIFEIYSSLGADASYDLRAHWLEIRLRHAENVAEPAKYNERLVSRLAYLMSCQTPFFSKKDIDKKNHIGRLFYMYYWSDEFVGPDDYDDIVDGCYTLSAEKANATVKNVFGVSIPDYKADYIDETSDFYCRDGVYRFSLGDFWLYFDSMTLTPLSSDEYLLEYTIHGIPDGPNTDGGMIKYGPGRIIIRADESSSYGFIVTAVINNPFDAARIVH